MKNSQLISISFFEKYHCLHCTLLAYFCHIIHLCRKR